MSAAASARRFSSMPKRRSASGPRQEGWPAGQMDLRPDRGLPVGCPWPRPCHACRTGDCDADGKITGLRVKTTANLGAYLSTFSSSVPTYLYAPLAVRLSTTSRRSMPRSTRSTPTPRRSMPIAAQGGPRRPSWSSGWSRSRPASWAWTRPNSASRTTSRNSRTRHPVIMMYDAGDYNASMKKALEIADYKGFRQAQARLRPQRQAARHRFLLLYRGLRHRAHRPAVGSLGCWRRPVGIGRGSRQSGRARSRS